MNLSKQFKTPSYLPYSKELTKAFNSVANFWVQHERKQKLFPQLLADLKSGKIDHHEAAKRIAESVHLTQTRRDGKPYMSHIWGVYNAPDHHVYMSPYTQTQKMLALVHDVIEDSYGIWTIKDFAKLGFDDEFIRGLEGLTKKPSEKYFDYIERCSLTPGANVKLGDNLYNWQDNPKPLREKLYRVAVHYQRAIETGKIKAGSDIAAFAAKEGFYEADLFREYSSHPVIADYEIPKEKAHRPSLPPSAVGLF